MRDQSPRSKPAVEHHKWYGGQLNSSHTQFKDVSATFSASNVGAVTTAHDEGNTAGIEADLLDGVGNGNGPAQVVRAGLFFSNLYPWGTSQWTHELQRSDRSCRLHQRLRGSRHDAKI